MRSLSCQGLMWSCGPVPSDPLTWSPREEGGGCGACPVKACPAQPGAARSALIPALLFRLRAYRRRPMGALIGALSACILIGA